MKKGYPASLFLMGFMLNLVARNFILFISALILILIGIWVKECLLIGIAVLALDAVISFIIQMKMRSEMMNNDDPDFQPFRDAVLSSDWQANVMDLVEQKVEDNSENSFIDEEDEHSGE